MEFFLILLKIYVQPLIFLMSSKQLKKRESRDSYVANGQGEYANHLGHQWRMALD